MKVVVDIPEEYYNALKQANVIVKGQRSGKTLESVIYNAVGNGTPLEKVFDDIKAEIYQILDKYEPAENQNYFDSGLQKALEIIDKHINGKEQV